MRLLKDSYQKTKHHHKNFLLLLLTSLLTPIVVFAVYSVFPPTVKAALIKPLPTLDTSFSAEIWGLVNQKSISFETSPKIPMQVKFNPTNFPLKTLVSFEPTETLAPNTTYTLKVNIENWFGLKSQKTLTQTTGAAPRVLSVAPKTGSIDIGSKTNLDFQLDQSLNRSSFKLKTQPEANFETESKNNNLRFSPKSALKQGQKYTYTLYLTGRSFNDINLVEGEFTTTSPLEIVSVEPANQATAVLKSQTIKIVFNKPVDQQIFENGFSLEPLTKVSFAWVDPKTVLIKPDSLLLSATSYTLNLGISISAIDKSHLESALVSTFTVAGPVKVVSFSPTGAYPYLNTNINVVFDQPVDQASAISHFLVEPNTQGSFSFSGNQLIFKPKSLAALTEYKITISPGVVSVGGENSSTSFTNTFTTTSEQTRTIGYSVKGRPITATYFGIGPKKILLIGSIHGSESNTAKMLASWTSYLRANQRQIANDRTFIIVASSNPDGVAANNRFNANGVDLNRNWDLPDWQPVSYWLNSSFPNGGGSAPFSEPETQSLRDLIIRENPSKIITYHSAANLVIGGGASNSFAAWYSTLSGYGLSTNTDDSSDSCLSALGYCVTGTMEEWAGKRGNPTIVVEFSSMTNSEYTKNLPALKGLLTYQL